MSRDVKIGMLIGLLIVAVALVAMSAWPGAAAQDRIRRTQGQSLQKADSTPIVPPPVRSDIPTEAVRPPRDDVNEAARWVMDEPRLPLDPPPPRVHIVLKDENLSTIAQMHYGDANKWPLIAEANKDVLPDVNRVRPGIKLVIPLPKGN